MGTRRSTKPISVLIIYLLCFLIPGTGSSHCTDDGTDFFHCAVNNECISATFVCDGENDCTDGSDERICQMDILEDNYLVVVDRQGRSLYQMNLDSEAQRAGGRVVPLPTNLVKSSFVPYAAAFDAVHRIVYWTDLTTGRIMRNPLHGRRRPSDPEIGRQSAVATHVFTVPRIGSAAVTLSGVAVDAVGKKLYYCDAGRVPKIGELSIDDDNDDDGRQHRIVFTERDMKPRAVAVYDAPGDNFPDNRFIYWTDYGRFPAINRVSLRPGSGKQTVVWNEVVQPYGISIDANERSLYWTDGSQGRIERSDLDGSNRRLLYSRPTDNYGGLTLSNRYIYVTDYAKRFVRRLDRQTFEMIDQLPALTQHLVDVVYYNSSEHPRLQTAAASATSMTTTTKTKTRTSPGGVTQPSASRQNKRLRSTTVMTTSTSTQPVTSRELSGSETSVALHTETSESYDDVYAEQSALVERLLAAKASTINSLDSATDKNTVLSIVIITVVGAVLIVAIVTLGIVFISVRLKRRVEVDDAKGAAKKRSIFSGPPANRQNNHYDYIQPSPGLVHGSGRSPRGIAASIPETRQQRDGDYLKPVEAWTIAARSVDDDTEGYLIPSIKTEGDDVSDVYNSLAESEDGHVYSQPNEGIYEVI